MLATWGAWGDVWAFADPVSIDGPARTVTVDPGVATVTTTEIYSSWVRWAAIYDHLTFLPAMRTVGGDALPGGQSTGLFLFLTHGWQVVIGHNVKVDGIIYHDDEGVDAFVVLAGGGVTNKVAALAYGINTGGGTVIGGTYPSAAEIAAEIIDLQTRPSATLQAASELSATLETSIPLASDITATATVNAELTTAIQSESSLVSDAQIVAELTTEILLSSCPESRSVLTPTLFTSGSVEFMVGVYTADGWVNAPMRRWNGSTWVDVLTIGFDGNGLSVT